LVESPAILAVICAHFCGLAQRYVGQLMCFAFASFDLVFVPSYGCSVGA
jgi:hypothetical protein